MCTPDFAARLVQNEDAASLLLEAERAALAGVGHCERQALLLVAASWLRAELLHKRVEDKIERLRARMAAAAQRSQLRMVEEMAALAGDVSADASMLALLDSAVDRITQELAGISESS